eukprot:519459_1
MVEYYLRCDLYEGYVCNGDMFVQVEIAHNKAMSQPKKINDNNNGVKWYETLVSQGNPDQSIGPFLLPDGWNENPKPVVLPDVFIYLCVKEFGSGDIEQVSYCRVKMKNIIPAPSKKGTLEFKPGKKRMWQNVPVWYDMKGNLASDKYSANVFPGALLIALNAGPKSDVSKEYNNGKLVTPPAISRPFNEKLVTPPALSRPFSNEDLFKYVPTLDVIIKCFEAVDLPAMNFFGLGSDPYVEIVIEDKNGKRREKECKSIRNNLNPRWNQDLEFNNVSVGDKLYLRVLDWNNFAPDVELGFIDPMILTGDDSETWIKLKPGKEVQEKYRRKLYKIKNMKIKIGIKYVRITADDRKKRNERKKRKKKKKEIFSLFFEEKQKPPIDRLSEPKISSMQL